MVSHSDRHFYYTADHGKVKVPSPGLCCGLGGDDGQSLGVAACLVAGQGEVKR